MNPGVIINVAIHWLLNANHACLASGHDIGTVAPLQGIDYTLCGLKEKCFQPAHSITIDKRGAGSRVSVRIHTKTRKENRRANQSQDVDEIEV